MFETLPSEAEICNLIRSFDVTYLRVAKEGVNVQKG
jgi:hypothetical protein